MEEPAKPASLPAHCGGGVDMVQSVELQGASGVPSMAPLPDLDIPPERFRPDRRFWSIMASLMMATFLSALDVSCIAIALPTIARDLNGANSYLWVGNAYALTSTALIPWTGSLAAIFGRKPILLGAIFIFTVGSAACGASRNMTTMIAGRAVAGTGGGGILVLSQIIVTDIVPLAQRGPYFGLMSSVWALASTSGPLLSGGLTSLGQWRWLFWINLPIAAVAFCLVVVFMDVKKPHTTFKEKVALMDWYNLIFVGSATSIVLALSWAGTERSWNSTAVLAPLILGLAGLVFFVWIERYAKNPTVPFSILSHPTCLIGFTECITQGTLMMAITYYFPSAYFQAAKGYSAVRSGVDSLPMSAVVPPCAFLMGIIVNKIGKYKYASVIAWCWILVGSGLFTLLQPSSPTVMWVLFPLIAAVGNGLLQTGTVFPTLAPLPPQLHPAAMAFLDFTKASGSVLGIAVGGTLLQNELQRTLPLEFVALFPAGQELAFAAIPIIPVLQQPLLGEVQKAFADSLRSVSYLCLGLAAFGFITAFLMKDLPLSRTTDENWGLETLTGPDDEAKGERCKAIHPSTYSPEQT